MFCPYCKQDKQEVQFYKSPIKTGEYIIPCKACVTELYKQALNATKDQGAALWSTCMQAGIPMRSAEYKSALETLEKAGKGKKPSLFMIYWTYLSSCPDKLTGVWDSDMELSRFIDLGDVAKAEKDAKEDKARWQKTWGSDYEEWEYQWMDDLFNSYTNEILEMDTAMEMTYQALCRAHLRKFKDPTDKDASDEILKLMKVLKLDQFKENKRSDTEKFIDRWAFRIENEEPAEVEDFNKYKDYAGNEKMWKDVLRTVRNAISGSRQYPEISFEDKE